MIPIIICAICMRHHRLSLPALVDTWNTLYGMPVQMDLKESCLIHTLYLPSGLFYTAFLKPQSLGEIRNS